MNASVQNTTTSTMPTAAPTRAQERVSTYVDSLRLDHFLATIDQLLGRQIDSILHHPAFQTLESAWRGLQFLVDRTDFRRNVFIEMLDVSKETLCQDFDDAPELIQSGLFLHTYVQEYDTPGAYPVSAVIANYEFDASALDVALLRNLSKVAAAAHMPFIGAVSPAFFRRESMEDVSGIRDLSGYFERAAYANGRRFAKRTTHATSVSRCLGFSRAFHTDPIRTRYAPSNTPKTFGAAAAMLSCGPTRHSPSQ